MVVDKNGVEVQVGDFIEECEDFPRGALVVEILDAGACIVWCYDQSYAFARCIKNYAIQHHRPSYTAKQAWVLTIPHMEFDPEPQLVWCDASIPTSVVTDIVLELGSGFGGKKEIETIYVDGDGVGCVSRNVLHPARCTTIDNYFNGLSEFDKLLSTLTEEQRSLLRANKEKL